MTKFKDETIQAYKDMLSAFGATYVEQVGLKQKMVVRLSCGHERDVWSSALMQGLTWMSCKECKRQKQKQSLLDRAAAL